VPFILDSFLVITALLDAVAAELVAQIVLRTLRKFMPPLLYAAEHDSAALGSTIITITMESGMMENTIDDPVDSTLGVSAFVIPALDDLRDDPL
jgi:hypothetical protein